MEKQISIVTDEKLRQEMNREIENSICVIFMQSVSHIQSPTIIDCVIYAKEIIKEVTSLPVGNTGICG